MSEKKSMLPKFRYHPNIYDTDKVLDGVTYGEGICQCCGNHVSVYIDTIYAREEADCICLECVASGKAAEKFDGDFIQDAEEVSDSSKTEELFMCTPGYCSW